MADDVIRALERRFGEEGSQEARDAWETALVRAGHPSRAELGARLVTALLEMRYAKIVKRNARRYGIIATIASVMRHRRLLPLAELTCRDCLFAPHCPSAFDDYNTHGDCLENK